MLPEQSRLWQEMHRAVTLPKGHSNEEFADKDKAQGLYFKNYFIFLFLPMEWIMAIECCWKWNGK